MFFPFHNTIFLNNVTRKFLFINLLKGNFKLRFSFTYDLLNLYYEIEFIFFIRLLYQLFNFNFNRLTHLIGYILLLKFDKKSDFEQLTHARNKKRPFIEVLWFWWFVEFLHVEHSWKMWVGHLICVNQHKINQLMPSVVN